MKTLIELYKEWAVYKGGTGYVEQPIVASSNESFMAGAAAMASLFATEWHLPNVCSHRWNAAGYCIDCGIRIDRAVDLPQLTLKGIK
jgi:hypothetical protein